MLFALRRKIRKATQQCNALAWREGIPTLATWSDLERAAACSYDGADDDDEGKQRRSGTWTLYLGTDPYYDLNDACPSPASADRPFSPAGSPLRPLAHWVNPAGQPFSIEPGPFLSCTYMHTYCIHTSNTAWAVPRCPVAVSTWAVPSTTVQKYMAARTRVNASSAGVAVRTSVGTLIPPGYVGTQAGRQKVGAPVQ